MHEDARRVAYLRDRLEETLTSQVKSVRLNGARCNRIPGCSSITFPGVPADALMANLPHLQFSSTSACSSGFSEPSHVLVAMGLSRDLAMSTIRIGVGRFTVDRDVDDAACMLAATAEKLQGIAAENPDRSGQELQFSA
jgi:cysteine desulfurase